MESVRTFRRLGLGDQGQRKGDGRRWRRRSISTKGDVMLVIAWEDSVWLSGGEKRKNGDTEKQSQ